MVAPARPFYTGSSGKPPDITIVAPGSSVGAEESDAETYVSAEQSQARQSSRISRPHEKQGWPRGIVAPPRPWPPQVDCQ